LGESETLPEDVDVSRLALRSVWQSGDKWLRSYRAQPYLNEETTQEIVEALFDSCKARPLPSIPYEKVSGGLAVVNVYDCPLDKIAHPGRSDPATAFSRNVSEFLRAIEKITAYAASQGVDRILFPVGNDFYHTNDFNRKTKKGTELDYYLDSVHAYQCVNDALIKAIGILYQAAPVSLLPIRGNHDEDKVGILSYWLGRVYEGHNGVNVIENRDQRYYYRYGANLLGFAHGDKEKRKIAQLPLLMAQEQPQLWGDTVHRKFFLGDLRHQFEYHFLRSKDYPGCEVQFLRSAGVSDTYHVDNGWVGVPRTAYVHLFDEQNGEVGVRKFAV